MAAKLDQALANGSAKVRQFKPKSKADNADAAPWTDKLQRTNSGKPYALELNAEIAMREAPEWRGLLAYDEFAGETIATRETPWGSPAGRWNPTDDTHAAIWLQTQGIHVKPDTVGRTVEAVARDNKFHPVRQYLNAQTWDKTPRIDKWISDYLGAIDTPLNRAFAAKWLIGGVARIYKPGCKVDTALVLEGPQGAKKSTALRTLAMRDDWFTDRVENVRDKDAVLAIQGKLIVELAELETVTGKQETGAVKAFLTRQNDRMRPPYGRRDVDFPRQCIFGGSVNEETYLRDATGGRRFWPIKCGKIDIEGLREIVGQLWAEAVHRYRVGENWWLDDPEMENAAREEQAARYQGDVWSDKIDDYIEGKNEVSVYDVLSSLSLDAQRMGQPEQNRVARELKRRGWERKLRRQGERRTWIYARPRPPADTPEDFSAYTGVSPVRNTGDATGDTENLF